MYKVKVYRVDEKDYFIEVSDINDLECWVISNKGTWLSLEYAKALKKIVLSDRSFMFAEILSISELKKRTQN